MTVAAQALPKRPSVYAYPASYPGVEQTQEQQEQTQLAQVAQIVLATAAAKEAINAFTTKTMMGYMRSLDLATPAGVAAFQQLAKVIVGLAVRKSQEYTWAAVSARARIVGATMSRTMPSRDEMPPNLRVSRGSSLTNAYARVAEEYKENLKRTKDDPIIKDLVSQLEVQGFVLIPRPNSITNDAVEREPEYVEWKEAFRKAEEATGTPKSEVDAWAESQTTATTNIGEAAQRAVEAAKKRAAEAEDKAAEAEDKAADSRETDTGSQSDAEASGGDSSADTGESAETDSEDAGPQVKLTDEEIDIVIKQYAEHKAEERVERMVSHDVQAASRNMHNVAINSVTGKKLAGFRRVVHPELAKSGKSCGLCIVASTMWYTKRDLLPIHSGCNCETVEIYELDNGDFFDPGGAINEDDLEFFYKVAGDSTHGWDLKKAKYKVVDHPEFGPTLVPELSAKKRAELKLEENEGVRYER